MQILSHELTRKFAGKAIHVYPSFLPNFKGAKPYHQAFEWGGGEAYWRNGSLCVGRRLNLFLKYVKKIFYKKFTVHKKTVGLYDAKLIF